MARAEIFTITKKAKNIKFYADVPGASRGALYVWQALEDKYLPVKTSVMGTPLSRFILSMTGRLKENETEDPMQEIWDLVEDDRLTENEKYTLAYSFDNTYVPYNSLLRVAEALENFEPGTTETLIGIAKVFREIHEKFSEKRILGVAVNSTSVVSMEECYDKNNLIPVEQHFVKNK